MYVDLERILLSILIGAIIGLEREYRSKSAGLRTMILVCVGSCIFTLLSYKIGLGSQDRIAANVLTGIGFLGAGVIFREKDRVTGITTATTIWVVSALGMTIGAGFELLACVTSAIVIIILSAFILVQNLISKLNHVRVYTLKFEFSDSFDYKHVEALFKKLKMKILYSQKIKSGKDFTFNLTVQGSEKAHHLIASQLLKNDKIKHLEF
ncbi:MgtC/SapB family protein [Aquirufa ecclesiirivi]|uniref:MgtC/SapB family protein n=1 Tax=Aquirufa ecclesiirivi TaxID=2715124 RepID=A0ABT4JJX0_9BACT|nr:MgtC/SapB family protein [Aquirufa ecclesiirivi]MCZ2471422.1 MgtC/SapB family protein [Aquirufa ecclesiirivi]MCZ2475856.1 MgtC/SapB family protein [Aquirufa ecclesiirivi]NHC49260.1 MgtC/SapB family protein [Aquirufa ecclesiirivi]